MFVAGARSAAARATVDQGLGAPEKPTGGKALPVATLGKALRRTDRRFAGLS